MNDTIGLIQASTILLLGVCVILIVIRIRRIERRLRRLEQNHETLVAEIKQAFRDWGAWAGQDVD